MRRQPRPDDLPDQSARHGEERRRHVDRPPQALTLVVTKAKGASVSSIPAGITACDRTCSASFGYGAQVTLTATLGRNASVNWGGCDRTTAPPGVADTCTLSMTSAKIITATFR